MASTATLQHVITEFPADVQVPMWHFAEWLENRLMIPHQDFEELKQTVKRLAEGQERLTAAQERTETKVEQLAEAQKRTEEKVERLAEAQERLTSAQERTETMMQQLASEMQDLSVAHRALEKSMSDRFAELGSRWGVHNEGTFRETIRGVFKCMDGVTVEQGFYGGRQVDVIIRNGQHIMLEITSRMHARDIDNLYKSADNYREKEGIESKLMVATSYISPKLMKKIVALERPIEIFSYEEE